MRAPNDAVALPKREKISQEEKESALIESHAASAEEPTSDASTIAVPSEPETPATSQAPSESDYTNVSTPATPVHATAPPSKPTPTQQQHTRKDTRSAIAVPVLPNLAKPKEQTPPSTANNNIGAKTDDDAVSKSEHESAIQETTPATDDTPKTPPPKPAPKSWAELVKRNAKSAASTAAPSGETLPNGLQLPKSAPLSDALKQYSVQSSLIHTFLEPRGLVNTGNMCYMNSVSHCSQTSDFHKLTCRLQILQVLVFCVPFYNFLDQVRQRTVYSMKSETPLVDAMILFMREFKSLASAESVDGLRSVLKQEQLEQYGDSVTPDYVYEVIRKLPRFAGMRVSPSYDCLSLTCG